MPQVQIVVDKLPEENMTEKEYLNGFLTNLRAAAKAQNAFLNILSSGKKKTLGGQEFTSVETILQKGDYVIYSKHYFMLKDNYSLGISILYNDNTEWCMPEVLDTFTAYE
jgi:hypothetical protein